MTSVKLAFLIGACAATAFLLVIAVALLCEARHQRRLMQRRRSRGFDVVSDVDP